MKKRKVIPWTIFNLNRLPINKQIKFLPLNVKFTKQTSSILNSTITINTPIKNKIIIELILYKGYKELYIKIKNIITNNNLNSDIVSKDIIDSIQAVLISKISKKYFYKVTLTNSISGLPVNNFYSSKYARNIQKHIRKDLVDNNWRIEHQYSDSLCCEYSRKYELWLKS